MISLIVSIIIIYLIIGTILTYVKRDNKTNGFKPTSEDIKQILLWYQILKSKKENN